MDNTRIPTAQLLSRPGAFDAAFHRHDDHHHLGPPLILLRRHEREICTSLCLVGSLMITLSFGRLTGGQPNLWYEPLVPHKKTHRTLYRPDAARTRHHHPRCRRRPAAAAAAATWKRFSRNTTSALLKADYPLKPRSVTTRPPCAAPFLLRHLLAAASAAAEKKEQSVTERVGAHPDRQAVAPARA